MEGNRPSHSHTHTHSPVYLEDHRARERYAPVGRPEPPKLSKIGYGSVWCNRYCVVLLYFNGLLRHIASDSKRSNPSTPTLHYYSSLLLLLLSLLLSPIGFSSSFFFFFLKDCCCFFFFSLSDYGEREREDYITMSRVSRLYKLDPVPLWVRSLIYPNMCRAIHNTQDKK